METTRYSTDITLNAAWNYEIHSLLPSCAILELFPSRQRICETIVLWLHQIQVTTCEALPSNNICLRPSKNSTFNPISWSKSPNHGNIVTDQSFLPEMSFQMRLQVRGITNHFAAYEPKEFYKNGYRSVVSKANIFQLCKPTNSNFD